MRDICKHCGGKIGRPDDKSSPWWHRKTGMSWCTGAGMSMEAEPAEGIAKVTKERP